MKFPKGYVRQMPEHSCLDCAFLNMNILQQIGGDLRCTFSPGGEQPIVEQNAICSEWVECEEWDCDKEDL